MIQQKNELIFDFNQKFNMSIAHSIKLLQSAYDFVSEMNIIKMNQYKNHLDFTNDEKNNILKHVHHKLYDEFAFDMTTSEITDNALYRYENINRETINNNFKVNLIHYKAIQNILFHKLMKKVDESKFEKDLVQTAQNLIQKNIMLLYKKYTQYIIQNNVIDFVYHNQLTYFSNSLFLKLPKEFRINVMKEKINARTIVGSRKQIHIPQFYQEPIFIKEILFSNINLKLKSNYLSEHSDLSFIDEAFLSEHLNLIKEMRKSSYLFDKLASKYPILN